MTDKEKQIEEMAKSKKCGTCIHNSVCQELEEFRDPLGWIDTKDEFVCSYYVTDKASNVAREIFEKVDEIAYRYLNDADYSGGDMIYDLTELKNKYTEEEK